MRFARFAAASAVLTLAVGGFASAGFAANPHFQDGPDYTKVNNELSLQATGSIAGIGKDNLDIRLAATAVVKCVSHLKNGDHTINGLSKSVSSSGFTVEEKNGRLEFTVATDPVDAKCPGKKMDLQISYEDAHVDVLQNGALVLSSEPVDVP